MDLRRATACPSFIFWGRKRGNTKSYMTFTVALAPLSMALCILYVLYPTSYGICPCKHNPLRSSAWQAGSRSPKAPGSTPRIAKASPQVPIHPLFRVCVQGLNRSRQPPFQISSRKSPSTCRGPATQRYLEVRKT